MTAADRVTIRFQVGGPRCTGSWCRRSAWPAASGGKEMFVELGRRGLLVEPT